MRRALTLVLLVGLIGGCKLDPLGGGSSVDRTLVVRSGVSFGECIGYCWRELVIDPETTSWTEHGTDLIGYPTRTQSMATSTSDWERVRSAVDFSTFRGLPGVYGCPDCADGGAEWIEITFDGETKRILFEYGDTVQAISGLTTLLRSRRADFENQ